MKKYLFVIAILIASFLGVAAQDKTVLYRKGTNQTYERVGYEQKDGYRVVVFNGKYGIVNRDLNETVTPKYDKIEEWGIECEKGLWIVRLNGMYGVITSEGREILPCVYKYIAKYSDFEGKYNSTWIVCTEDGAGIFDDAGREIIPCIYHNVTGGADYFVVDMQDKDYHREYALFNGAGRRVTHFKYTGGIDRLSNELWRVYTSVQDSRTGYEAVFWEDYGIINSRGEEVVPLSYDYISFRISEDRIVIRDKKGKYGFLDANSLKEAITPQYDWTGDYIAGYSAVIINKKVGFINNEGHLVIPCEYEPDYPMMMEGSSYVTTVHRMNGFNEFSFGVTFVKKNGLYGLIDKKGNELSSFIYERVDVPQLREYNPFAFEVQDKNEKHYYMGMSGTIFMDKYAAENDSYEYVKSKVAEGDADYYELFGVWCYRRKEYQDARKWLLTGYANKGYLKYAAETLGSIYEYGLGCDKNLAEAKEWYLMAVNSKNHQRSAEKALDRVQAALSK